MTEARLIELLLRRLSGDENAGEVIELEAWVNGNQERAELVAMVTDGDVLSREMTMFAGFGPINGVAKWKVKRPEAPKPAVRRITLWGVAAAVLVLVAGIFIVYTINHQKAPEPATVKVPAAEVAPGRNTALLTLSNGKDVLLDSIKPGERLSDVNTSMMKADSTVLDYRSDGKASGEKPATSRESGNLYNTLTTARSGQYQVRLPDGTRVWLNNVSSLRYPIVFSGKDRVVELTGEGYFEIARDATRPFVVKVRNEEVTVLGTSFNVMAYADETATKTTVVTGKVRVRTAKASAILSPGEELQVDSAGQTNILKNVETEDVVSWKNGFFYFGHTNLANVMRQVSRWYDVEIIFEGRPGDVTFDGEIERNLPLTELLKFFEKNKIQCRLVGRQLYVQPN